MAEFIALQPRPVSRTPPVLMHESGDHPEVEADRLARSVAAQGIHSGAVGRPNPDPFRPSGRLGGREVPAPKSVTRTLTRSGSPLDCECRESRPWLWPAKLLSLPSCRDDHQSCACGSCSY
jgi:hypothetical protein